MNRSRRPCSVRKITGLVDEGRDLGSPGPSLRRARTRSGPRTAASVDPKGGFYGYRTVPGVGIREQPQSPQSVKL
jgi:hypothetical protein